MRFYLVFFLLHRRSVAQEGRKEERKKGRKEGVLHRWRWVPGVLVHGKGVYMCLIYRHLCNSTLVPHSHVSTSNTQTTTKLMPWLSILPPTIYVRVSPCTR